MRRKEEEEESGAQSTTRRDYTHRIETLDRPIYQENPSIGPYIHTPTHDTHRDTLDQSILFSPAAPR